MPGLFFAGDLGHSRFDLVGLSAEKMENPVATGPEDFSP